MNSLHSEEKLADGATSFLSSDKKSGDELNPVQFIEEDKLFQAVEDPVSVDEFIHNVEDPVSATMESLRQSTWIPSILMKSSEWKMDESSGEPCVLLEPGYRLVDIVRVMNIAENNELNSYLRLLHYPSSAVFKFTSFVKGIEDQENIVEMIQNNAREKGSTLVILCKITKCVSIFFFHSKSNKFAQ